MGGETKRIFSVAAAEDCRPSGLGREGVGVRVGVRDRVRVTDRVRVRG